MFTFGRDLGEICRNHATHCGVTGFENLWETQHAFPELFDAYFMHVVSSQSEAFYFVNSYLIMMRRCSIVVSIPACHAGDPGSIPDGGDCFFAEGQHKMSSTIACAFIIQLRSLQLDGWADWLIWILRMSSTRMWSRFVRERGSPWGRTFRMQHV